MEYKRHTDKNWRRRIYQYSDEYKLLAEYEDLEEQGLLVRLPYNVGTEVFIVRVAFDCVFRGVVESITNTRFGHSLYVKIYDGDLLSGCNIKFDQFGNTMFLTREEAEKRLKELQGAND